MSPPRRGRPPLTPLEAAVAGLFKQLTPDRRDIGRPATSLDVAAALDAAGFPGPDAAGRLLAFLRCGLGRADVRLDLVTYEVVVGGVYAGYLPDAVTLLVAISRHGLTPKPLSDPLPYGRAT